MKRYLLLIDDMESGGAERQMSYLAMQLKKKGHQVLLYKFYPGDNFYGKELEGTGIQTRIASCGVSKIKRPFFIANLIKKYKPNSVIVYKDGACMAACLAKFLTSFNLIVSERNTTQVLNNREKLKFQLYRMADYVVCNSQSQADFIRKNVKYLTMKVCVITNMIDTQKFSPAIKKNLVPTVVTTARIAPQKNVLKYVKALYILKKRGVRVHFDWFGLSGQNEYSEQVFSLIADLQLSDYITIHKASSSVEDVYKNATYFCLPSLYEGFPNVLCEAMSSGLICCASNVCDNPYILSDKEFLFNPEEEESIADTLEYALKLDEYSKDRISKTNRDCILELCSPEAFISKYESLSK